MRPKDFDDLSFELQEIVHRLKDEDSSEGFGSISPIHVQNIKPLAKELGLSSAIVESFGYSRDKITKDLRVSGWGVIPPESQLRFHKKVVCSWGFIFCGRHREYMEVPLCIVRDSDDSKEPAVIRPSLTQARKAAVGYLKSWIRHLEHKRKLLNNGKLGETEDDKDKSGWECPSSHIAVSDIRDYQGKVVPRNSVQKWVSTDIARGKLLKKSILRHPISCKCHYPRDWVEPRLAKYNQNKKAAKKITA